MVVVDFSVVSIVWLLHQLWFGLIELFLVQVMWVIWVVFIVWEVKVKYFRFNIKGLPFQAKHFRFGITG